MNQFPNLCRAKANILILEVSHRTQANKHYKVFKLMIFSQLKKKKKKDSLIVLSVIYQKALPSSTPTQRHVRRPRKLPCSINNETNERKCVVIAQNQAIGHHDVFGRIVSSMKNICHISCINVFNI